MITRKFRLIIERNKTRFSDNSSVLIDIQTSFIRETRYSILSVDIPKWMKDMLGDPDYQLVKDRLDEHGKKLWEGKDGVELIINL
jgi:hypothetical protein